MAADKKEKSQLHKVALKGMSVFLVTITVWLMDWCRVIQNRRGICEHTAGNPPQDGTLTTNSSNIQSTRYCETSWVRKGYEDINPE
jgi:hypothetical protein